MEPRARAGKNVGKMNFSYQELTQFLIAHGDSRQPLQETMKVIDEILTEFIQGVSFEASRVAQLSGRQKVKYEDFQFAMRKNPMYLGKAAENKELREALDKQRKMFDEDEYTKDDPAGAAAAGAAAGGSSNNRGRKRKGPGATGTETSAAAAAAAAAEGAEGGHQQQQQQQQQQSGSAGLDDEELGDADDEDIDLLVAPSHRRA